MRNYTNTVFKVKYRPCSGLHFVPFLVCGFDKKHQKRWMKLQTGIGINHFGFVAMALFKR